MINVFDEVRRLQQEGGYPSPILGANLASLLEGLGA
jgi:hypothetical protein